MPQIRGMATTAYIDLFIDLDAPAERAIRVGEIGAEPAAIIRMTQSDEVETRLHLYRGGEPYEYPVTWSVNIVGKAHRDLRGPRLYEALSLGLEDGVYAGSLNLATEEIEEAFKGRNELTTTMRVVAIGPDGKQTIASVSLYLLYDIYREGEPSPLPEVEYVTWNELSEFAAELLRSGDVESALSTLGVTYATTEEALEGEKTDRVMSPATVLAAINAALSGLPAPPVTSVNGKDGDVELTYSDVAAASDEDARFPTSDEKNALGGTSGAPSASNKYVTNDDARLDDTRDPNPHTHGSEDITDASSVGVELLTAEDAEAARETLGLGTAAQADLPDEEADAGATQVVRGDDTRLTDARTPKGGAGGVLSGNYPNPGFAVDMVTQSELDNALGAANGIAELGSDGKLKTTQIPQALLGVMAFQSNWDADSNTPTIPASDSSNKGHYYLVTTPGGTSIDGISDWKLGDWVVSIGTAWIKCDNTDAVISVNGKTGSVAIVKSDIGLSNVDNTSDADKPISTLTQQALDEKADAASLPEFSEVGTELVECETADQMREVFSVAVTRESLFGYSQDVELNLPWDGSIYMVEIRLESASGGLAILRGAILWNSADGLSVLGDWVQESYNFDGVTVMVEPGDDTNLTFTMEDDDGAVEMDAAVEILARKGWA